MPKQLLKYAITLMIGAVLAASVTWLVKSHSKNTTPSAAVMNNVPSTITNQTITVAPTIDNQTINTAPAVTSDTHIWNLQNADIQSVITEITKETGYTFILPQDMTGKISIISNHPTNAQEAYQIFLTSLQSLGYSVVPADNSPKPNTYKIVQNTDLSDVPLATAPEGANVVVRVIPLQNEPAAQLIPILKPFLPSWANVQAYAPDNVMIIAAPSNDIDNIVKLVNAMESTSSNGTDVVPLQYATASDLATILNSMQGPNHEAGGSISVTADPRSNSLLLSGDRFDRLKMHALISSLDIPTPTGADTQVIFLHYLTAKDFAPVLAAIAQNAPQNAPNPFANMTTAKTQGSSVQAVVNQNAIIITAPPAEMNNLKAIVKQLDVRPAQVLIEAAIVEIDESQAMNLGIQWGSLGGGSTGSSDSDTDSTSTLQQAFSDGVGIIHDGDFAALVHALSTSSSANILSTPSIVVLNNHEANIDVGKQINVQSEAQAVAGAVSTTPSSTITSTFKQQNVALTLDVKPQVNGGNTVELNIKQKNDTLQDPNDTSGNPIINISGISTDVDVHSNDILVLGGLIKNQLTDENNQVPILGDIPLIGNAFKYKTHSVEKKYLMVFIHPKILRNAADDTAASDSKYDYIRKIQMAWKNGAPDNMNSSDGRVLAPRNNATPAPALPTPFSNPSQ